MKTTMTKIVVSEGRPPISFDISMATGVVMDRGNKLRTRSEFKCPRDARVKDEIIATSVPLVILTKILPIYFFNRGKCL